MAEGDRAPLTTGRSTGLVDILDRVLDKGLVIAGDIKISLANVELLTIQIRLLVCSIDKAEQIGLNWWRYEPALSRTSAEQDDLNARIDSLEQEIRRLTAALGQLQTTRPTRARRTARPGQ
ncbi:MAG TPA: gas vesicle protein [Chloroflexota bacterium]|nr:gas vesicle protein [Chloroflexota bacterium]